jgi:hypothetical protein
MWNVDERETRRKLAASRVEAVISNYSLELNQTGSKKARLVDTRPVNEVTGYWDNPADATNKPLRWILHVDLTSDSIEARLPDGHGANRMAFVNSGKGKSGAVFARIVPAMKLDEGRFEFFDAWEWILMFGFLPALDAGSAAQLIEGYDPETGGLLYKGRQQPYVCAGLIALNSPEDLYVGETGAGSRRVQYSEVTAALRRLLQVTPLEARSDGGSADA